MCMKRLCDLPINSVIECFGLQMVIRKFDDQFAYCSSAHHELKIKKTRLVKVITKPLKFKF